MRPIEVLPFGDFMINTGRVEKIVNGGWGIIRGPRGVAFIPGVIDGEIVDYRVLESKKQFVWGKVVKVREPSSQRVSPRCPWFGDCGGCMFQHMEYGHQRKVKEDILIENMARIGGLKPDVHAFHFREPWKYRCRVKLKSTDEGRVGFIRKGTNQVMPVTGCEVVEGGIRDFMDRWNRLSHPPFFHQMDGFLYQQRLYIYLSHAPDSRSREILESFSQNHSVTFSWKGKWEESVFQVTLREFTYLVSPSVFFQVNRRLWGPMLDTVEGMIVPGRKMIDLYAGVGFFTPLIKKYASTVTAVESGLAANLAARMLGTGTVQRISAEAFRYPPADLILVDPPRSGLSPRVIQSIMSRGYPHIIYVSCSPATLARDCRILVEQGGYRLEKVELLDLFPQTPHLESVVHLMRK